MMQRIDHTLISNILGNGWENYLSAPENDHRSAEETSFVDLASETRNNKG